MFATVTPLECARHHPQTRHPHSSDAQYISDLRQCRVREAEEKRVNREMAHIRQKFKDGNLDGYQKKKYLSKVVFTYILGYKVDVGHMEAVNLISSNKYSEKQIVCFSPRWSES